MAIDEIKALEIAIASFRAKGQPHGLAYSMDQHEESWEIEADPTPRLMVRIDFAGELIPEAEYLDPVTALSIAREYAAKHSLRWKPSFTLKCDDEHWDVGSCQSQLGGNVQIYVSHDGVAISHRVNPK